MQKALVLGALRRQKQQDLMVGVPAWLVKRNVKREFIDMTELFRDNLETERRAQSELEPRKFGTTGWKFRISPVGCCALYCMPLWCKAHSRKTSGLTYCVKVLPGRRQQVAIAFRQQFASIEVADFGTVDTTLFATTFFTYRRTVRGVCRLGMTIRSPVEGEGQQRVEEEDTSSLAE